MKKSIFSKKSLLGFSLALTLASSTALVSAGSHFKGHGHERPLERMMSHIELSETQEQQVEAILDGLHDKGDRKKKVEKMKAMMMLDPDSVDYMDSVEKQAEQKAEGMKKHILEVATARKDIHQLLTDEQKQELKALMEKRLDRMGKRCDHDDD